MGHARAALCRGLGLERPHHLKRKARSLFVALSCVPRCFGVTPLCLPRNGRFLGTEAWHGAQRGHGRRGLLRTLQARNQATWRYLALTRGICVADRPRGKCHRNRRRAQCRCSCPRREACASASRDGSSCTGSPLGSDCRAAVAAEAMLRWNARRRYLRRDGGIVSNLGPRPTFRAQGSPPQDQCERTCSQTCLMPCRPDGPRWKASASLK